jgi:hypothetical protein
MNKTCKNPVMNTGYPAIITGFSLLLGKTVSADFVRAVVS